MHKDAGKQLSHTAIYLIARGVPGLLAFLAIPLFTRLLDPAEYGHYALVISVMMLVNGLLFQWLRLSLIRYLPMHRDNPSGIKSTLATMTLVLIATVGVIALALSALPSIGRMIFPESENWRTILLICWALMAVQAGFDLCTEYCRAQMRPWRYMASQLMRAVCGIGLGSALILAGWNWLGPLTGLALGMGLAVAWIGFLDWRDIRLNLDFTLLSRVFRYGVPISITVALWMAGVASDRVMLKVFAGASAVGLYSAAFDFTSQSLVLLVMSVNMATFPLAVHAWEHEGRQAAQQQMRYNAALLLAVSLPSVIGLAVLGPGIAHSFFDEAYRTAAVSVIPVLAASAMLVSIKSFHFDAAFQFAHRTITQVWIAMGTVAFNVVLNLFLIPRYGIMGAAFASVTAAMASIGLTIWLGRRHVVLPFPWRQAIEVILASAAMAIVLLPTRHWIHPLALALQISAGAIIYGALLISMNFLGVRDGLKRKFNRWRSQRQSASIPTLVKGGSGA